MALVIIHVITRHERTREAVVTSSWDLQRLLLKDSVQHVLYILLRLLGLQRILEMIRRYIVNYYDISTQI